MPITHSLTHCIQAEIANSPQPVYMSINKFETCDDENIFDLGVAKEREIAPDNGRDIGQIKGQDKSDKARIFLSVSAYFGHLTIPRK